MDILPADAPRLKACKEGRDMIAYARPSLEWKLVEPLCKYEAQARRRRTDEPRSRRRSGAELYEWRAACWSLLR